MRTRASQFDSVDQGLDAHAGGAVNVTAEDPDKGERTELLRQCGNFGRVGSGSELQRL
jgi:hypothetical protein